MNTPLPRPALATALLLASVLAAPAWADTFEKRVVASADDAEATNTNSMYLNSSDLEFVVDGSTTQSAIGMRWTGVTIPKGATIATAWIQFTANEAHTETTNLLLAGQAADNATAFTSTNGNLTPAVRPRTAATVSWSNVPSWTAGAAGAAQRTPELKSILQEIVNRASWASGNALVLIVTGSGHRTAYSWDGSSVLAPLLHVEYTTAPPPNSPPVAGLTVTQPAIPPLTVLADGSTSTDTDAHPIATYRFDFGDGTPTVTANAPTATASHAYATAGTYTVTLQVTDTDNLTSSPVTRTITVQPEDPPTAALTVTPVASPALTVLADGAGSTDGDLTPIATYRFDFGDGTPTVTANAPATSREHTYASPGAYTISLVAVDTGGYASAPATQSVTVEVPPDEPPVAHLTVTRAPVPQLVVNADASGSTDGDHTPIASYRFDFGDGAPTVTANAPTATASHTYAAEGTYTVTLIVVDTAGNESLPVSQDILVVTQDDPPVAQLALTQPPTPARTVIADAAGSTDTDQTPIGSYRFDFGEGSPVTVLAPTTTASHSYATAGTKTVTVVAIDTGGKESAPVSRAITVQAENPPVASLTVSQTGSLSVTANASGSTDGDLTPIARYQFTWGDGTAATTVNAPNATASHVYAAAGTYTISVIATDTANLASAPASTTVTLTQSGAVEKRVSAGSDDAEQSSSGSVSLSSGDLELVQSSSNQTVGIRFTGIQVPRNAVITNAWIQFDARQSHSEATALRIQGEAVDHAATFTTASNNVGARPRTSSYGTWSPVPSWTSSQGQGPNQRTPNLAFPIQQIVNRAGWNSGNAMAFIITGTGRRSAYSYNGDAARAPLLHIEFGGSPPPQQPPVGSFTATSSLLTASVDASASTDGDFTPIATYRFDWGDGTSTTTTAPSATASHTYASGGTKTITLVVTDTADNVSTPVTRTVTVVPPTPPTAGLTVSANALVATGSGATSTAGTYPIATYRFTWGDGTPTTTATAPANSANHTYAAPGTYTVTLVVTDTQNLSSAPASASITVSNTPTSGTMDQRVAVGSDDAEQSASGSVSLTSNDLELVQDASTQTVGLRFTGIAIPRNAVISNAWIQFDAEESRSEATTLTIRGEAADNATTYTTGSNNVSNRPKTTSYATWTPVAWNSSDGQGANQRTPNLAFPIQQIVNRSGWNSGNAMSFIVTGTGRRNAYSYEGAATRAPLLHIEWGGSPPPQQAPVARLTVTASGLVVTADGSASTDGDTSPIASYRFQWGDGTSATTVNAPNATASHTYAVSGTYTVTLTCTDTGGRVSSPVTQSITVSGGSGGGSGIAVYAGYYSTHHPDNPRPKPSPWFGSPGIIFVGTPDDGVSSGWDTSAIRIDNLGTTGLSNVSVTCDIGSDRFALWSAQNIPAGGRLILAQTGYENFDGSDTNPAGCYDCDPRDCLTKVVSTVPVVNVTIGGTTTRYYDNAQTINTEGVDAAGCPYTGGRNDESRVWVRIYPQGGSAAGATEAVAADSTGAGSDSTDAVARSLAAGPRLSWVRRPYPNPSRGRIELMFRLGTSGNVDIGVFDVAGRLLREVSRVDLEAGDYLQQVNLAGMAPGMYYFTIATPEGRIRHPLVIVR